MSGDGVDDVDIPSVFMKNEHAHFLFTTWQEWKEVLVRLASDGGGGGKGEEGKDRTFESEFGTFKANPKGFAEYQQKLLGSIKTKDIKGDLKEDVEKFIRQELQRLSSSQGDKVGGVDLQNFLSGTTGEKEAGQEVAELVGGAGDSSAVVSEGDDADLSGDGDGIGPSPPGGGAGSDGVCASGGSGGLLSPPPQSLKGGGGGG